MKSAIEGSKIDANFDVSIYFQNVTEQLTYKLIQIKPKGYPILQFIFKQGRDVPFAGSCAGQIFRVILGNRGVENRYRELKQGIILVDAEQQVPVVDTKVSLESAA